MFISIVPLLNLIRKPWSDDQNKNTNTRYGNLYFNHWRVYNSIDNAL